MKIHHQLLASAALSACALVQAASSRFDTGAEGWTAIGDISAPLGWSASGGNPGGRVFISDQTTGGITYFVAPGAFLGNQSAAIGTNLTFDLMQVFPGASNQTNSSDVILQGGGLVLAYNTSTNPPNGSWGSYAVPLYAGGWRMNTLSGALATNEQLIAVLSSVTALMIRAEYQAGSDVGHLDNVSLVPEPASALLLAGGLVAMLRLRGSRRNTFRV